MRRIKHPSDKVLEYVFSADQSDIPKAKIFDSAFAQTFNAHEPKDSRGKSLYQLRTNRRMFRYPFDYIVCTETFKNLPQDVLD
ncbi:MAG TPA: hypothetical protein DCS60_08220 [Opitutae bacterium]|nr:hypothetical protein [Opitutae bacterium]